MTAKRFVAFDFDPRALEAKAPKPLSAPDKEILIETISRKLKEENAQLIAHYYTDADVQALAEKTGGFVSDSLEMARFGQRTSADKLIICGVRFMGETAKILSPEKRVFMPTLEAECSLDLSCPIEEFDAFCNQHPDRTVVVYANTSAAVKARADWVVTSSIGLEICAHLHAQGKKILWAPDKHLGHYIAQQTGADLLMWEGFCVVHDAFKANAVKELKKLYPHAAILVHPESPPEVVAMADVVGSTSKLIKAVGTLDADTFIVATDRGIFYKMQQLAPHKTLIDVPTGGTSATCVSCAHCPWMAMNGLEGVLNALTNQTNEILLEPELIKNAAISLQRMVDFADNHQLKIKEYR